MVWQHTLIPQGIGVPTLPGENNSAKDKGENSDEQYNRKYIFIPPRAIPPASAGPPQRHRLSGTAPNEQYDSRYIVSPPRAIPPV